MKMLKLLVPAVIAGGLVSVAFADDLNPPPWRGLPDSTFQHWTFGPNSPSGAPDGGVNNPNGTPLMFPSDGGTFYSPTVGNRGGVWGITGGDLRFHVPNDNDMDSETKLIWIQVTWQGQSLPGVSGVSSTDHSMSPVGDPHTVLLADGWNHTTWEFSLKECPEWEDIFISNSIPTGTTLLIDQVVIDTICIVPAPGAGALALAGLVAVGRRRR
ncbi:MAG: hypothetical protein U0573_04845 [Phycisphaerales bacterium]|nr:hypothetical protein [Planctomycetota bacterium]